MYTGKLVFSQLMNYLPWHTFRRCVQGYNGDRKVKSFFCSEQYRCMAFAQLTHRESLRDIETCLRAQAKRLSHMGISSGVSRSALAVANQNRDWRIYADFAQRLIRNARDLYHDDGGVLNVKNTVYALDSSTVDLCLTLFPWAHFRKTKSAVKLHTLLDLCGLYPCVHSHLRRQTPRRQCSGHACPRNPVPSISWIAPTLTSVVCTVSISPCVSSSCEQKPIPNTARTLSRKVDRSTGLICDQTIKLTGIKSIKDFPEPLRLVKYRDKERNKTLTFITNNFSLPAMTICELYRSRWHVELFFKWIKQHLRIKSFYGTSENAVKSQIWIAVSVYVLVAIIKKRLDLEASLYTILQTLSLTLFEKIPLNQLLTTGLDFSPDPVYRNQLKLFD